MGCNCCASEHPLSEDEKTFVLERPNSKTTVNLTSSVKQDGVDATAKLDFIELTVKTPREEEDTAISNESVIVTDASEVMKPPSPSIMEVPRLDKLSPKESPEESITKQKANDTQQQDAEASSLLQRELPESPSVSVSKRPKSSADASPTFEAGDVDGAYLVYDPMYDGHLLCLWKKENDPNAIAFCKPAEGVRVPPFKYKSRSELARNMSRNKKALCEGMLQYLRSVKAFRCIAQFRGVSHIKGELPQVCLVLHFPDNRIDILYDHGTFDLTAVDGIGVCLVGTQAERAIKQLADSSIPTPLDILQTRCRAHADGCEFLTLSRF